MLDHLGVEQTAVVGASLGGRAAVDLALAVPERVRALVLVGSGLAGHPFQEPALFELWDRSEGAIERGDHLEAARVELDTWVVGMDRGPSAVTPELRRRVEAMLLAAYAHGEADLEEPDPAAAGIPRAERVVLGGTAHLPNMERPEEFNRVVLEFLAKVGPAP
ncbi:MAG TPA: alpha/beta hydrolase [Actinomycetes bacterium]|nr:alpha/beta hydrolase [Actinomycetes bacterium]